MSIPQVAATLVLRILLRIWWNSEIFTKLCSKLSAIFHLFFYIYYALQCFHFCRIFEITIFAKILKNVLNFFKDSIFKAQIFAKLSLKYWWYYWCLNTKQHAAYFYFWNLICVQAQAWGAALGEERMMKHRPWHTKLSQWLCAGSLVNSTR